MANEGRNSDFRFERKFLTAQFGRQGLEQMVKMHPSCFRPLFHPRQVNNIYFDTPQLQFFEDNVAGRTDRKKVRIRWYGSDQQNLIQPVLEFKIKEGLVGRKVSYLLHDFSLPSKVSAPYFMDLFKRSDLPGHVLEYLSVLEPQLLNQYIRSYFLSFDKKFRITLDSELGFRDYRNTYYQTERMIYKPDSVYVLELKYAAKHDHLADRVVNQLPIRITKSSKYIMGVARFRPDAKF